MSKNRMRRSKAEKTEKVTQKSTKKSSLTKTQSHKTPQFSVAGHFLRLVSVLALNQTALSIPIRQSWNLAPNDFLLFNFSLIAGEDLKNVTLTPANKYFKIIKTPKPSPAPPAPPKPTSYPAVNVRFEYLSEFNSSNCTISRSVKRGEGLLHVFFICRKTLQTTILIGFKINRTETDQNKVASLIVNKYLNIASPPQKTSGFKNAGVTCYSIYHLKTVDLVIVSCLLQYTDDSTGSSVDEVPYIFAFQWDSNQNQYNRNYWFYPMNAGMPVAWRGEFDDLRLSWQLGLAGADQVSGNQAAIHLFSTKNYVQVGSNTLVSKVCWKTLALNLEVLQIATPPDDPSGINCVTPSTNFYQETTGANFRRRRRRALQDDEKNAELEDFNRSQKAQKIEKNLKKSSKTNSLRASNKQVVYLKKTFFVNTGTKTYQVNSVVLVSVIYSNLDMGKTILVVCVVDIDSSKPPNALKCSQSASAPTPNLRISLTSWYYTDVHFYRDKAGNYRLVCVYGTILSIFDVNFNSKQISVLKQRTLTGIFVRETRPLIQAQEQEIVIKYFITPSTKTYPRSYRNVIRGACFLDLNSTNFETSCQDLGYKNTTNFYAGPKSVLGSLSRLENDQSWIRIAKYIPSQSGSKPSNPVNPGPKKVVGDDFFLKINASGPGLQTLPYRANLTFEGQEGNRTLPLVFSSNSSLGFSKKKRDYDIMKGSVAMIEFGTQQVVGRFVKVWIPTMKVYDNRIQLHNLKFVQTGSGSGVKIPENFNLKKVFHMNSFGYLALWLAKSGGSEEKGYNNTLIFIKCTMKPQNISECQELSKYTLQTDEEVVFNTLHVFGVNFTLIQYSLLCVTEAGSITLSQLKIVDISQGKDTKSPETLNQTEFGLPQDFSKARAIYINSEISSFTIEMAMILPKDKIKKTAEAVYTSLIYNPVNKTFIPKGKPLIKSFQGDLTLISFEMGTSSFGAKYRVIKYRTPSHRRPMHYDINIYSDVIEGSGTNIEIKGGKETLLDQDNIFCSNFDQLFVYPGEESQNRTPFGIDFEEYPAIKYKYSLKLESRSTTLVQFSCLPRVKMVQALTKDKIKNKTHLVNYVLDNYDFRRRYHSRLQVDNSITKFFAYLSDNGRYIQTLLASSKPDVQDLKMVVTRVDSFQVKFNTDEVSGTKNSIKLVAVDQAGDTASSYVELETIQPAKQKLEFKPQILNRRYGERIPQKDLIHLNQKVDLDSFFNIQGSIADVGIVSTLKGLKAGVDYFFTTRKQTIGQLSVKEILPELKKPKSLQSTQKGTNRQELSVYLSQKELKKGKIQNQQETGLTSSRGTELIDYLGGGILSLLGVLETLKLEWMRTEGEWMVMRMSISGGPPYLKLVHNPKDFATRDRADDIKIESVLVSKTEMLKVVYCRLSIDQFYSTQNSSQILMAIMRDLYDSKTRKSTYYIQVYRSISPKNDSNYQNSPFQLISEIPLRHKIEFRDYRVLSVGQSRFCLIYRSHSVFFFYLFEVDQSAPMIVGIEGKKYYSFQLVTQYKKLIFPAPDYWTARLELYMDDMNDVMSGIMVLAGFYSKSWLRYFWWSADEMNDFRSSVPFALFTDIVVGTHLIDCEPFRDSNASAYQINNLGPNLVRIQCVIGADGAFNYVTQYTFDVSKTDQKPLVFSNLTAKIVSPDSFRTLQMEILPGTIVSKLANKDPYVTIDYKNASMCPYLIVVYKTNISMYPWAVYSCDDLNIKSQGDLPRFTSYRYSGDNFLWIDRKMQLVGVSEHSITTLDLSKINIVSSHTMKNTSIKFLKAFDFSHINMTLKTLNGNTMLKKLGLLSSSFMTPFHFSFHISRWILFPLMFLAFAIISYIYIIKDILNGRVKKYFFGEGVLKTLEYLNPNHQREEDMAPAFSCASISDDEDLQSVGDSASSKRSRKGDGNKIRIQVAKIQRNGSKDSFDMIDISNSEEDESSSFESDDYELDEVSVSEEDKEYNFDDRGSISIKQQRYSFAKE